MSKEVAANHRGSIFSELANPGDTGNSSVSPITMYAADAESDDGGQDKLKVKSSFKTLVNGLMLASGSLLLGSWTAAIMGWRGSWVRFFSRFSFSPISLCLESFFFSFGFDGVCATVRVRPSRARENLRSLTNDVLRGAV